MESVRLHCVRERMVKHGGLRWRLQGGALSGLYVPGPGVWNCCSNTQTGVKPSATDVPIVPAMEQFRFSVGTADSASLEVASGTGVLTNGSVS